MMSFSKLTALSELMAPLPCMMKSTPRSITSARPMAVSMPACASSRCASVPPAPARTGRPMCFASSTVAAATPQNSGLPSAKAPVDMDVDDENPP